MKKGFTLIELLTVMLIMGLMGTAAVGGYRAMQRGMEERGVMQNANAMIRAAYQRAQIDRLPTAIYFWNETIRGRTADENEVVVGKAVAVRRYGRLSNVIGNQLVDEFADLNLGYPLADGDDENDSTSTTMYLYPMDDLSRVQSSSSLLRSQVRNKIQDASRNEMFLTGPKGDDDPKISAWAFYCEDKGGVDWKAGMAYGFEFMTIELPVGYIFGSSYSTSTDDSIRTAGTLVFKPGTNSGSGLNTDGTMGRKSIAVYSLRPRGAALTAEKVGDTDSPEKSL